MIVTKKELIKQLRYIMRGESQFKHMYVERWDNKWKTESHMNSMPSHAKPWVMSFYYLNPNVTFQETEKQFHDTLIKTPKRFYFNDLLKKAYEFGKTTYEGIGTYEEIGIAKSMTYNRKVKATLKYITKLNDERFLNELKI